MTEARINTEAGSNAPTRVYRDGPLRPSFSQERLWFANQMGPRGVEFVYPIAMRMWGTLDVPLLAAALDRMVVRHETLRTTYRDREGELFQYVNPPRSLALTQTSIESEEVEADIVRVTEVPFDLERDLMLRARLYRVAEDEYVLLLVFHHIAVDGWSVEIFFQELAETYRQLLLHTEVDLPELGLQFADIAAWERARFAAGDYADELAFWRKRLLDCPHFLNLPVDYPRPAQQSFHGDWYLFDVPASTVSALKSVGDAGSSSLYMVLMAALQTTLARWTNQSEFIVGVPVANRDLTDTETLMGFFINLLPLAAVVDEHLTFMELLAQTRDRMLDAYDHQSLSLDRLVDEISPSRSLAHNALIQVTLNQEQLPDFTIPGIRIEAFDVRPSVTRYDLALDYVVRPDGSLHFDIYYATDLFDQESVERLAGRFAALIDDVAREPDAPLFRVSTLAMPTGPVAESAHAPEAAVAVVERFRASAAATPDAVAVVDAATELSFADLDRESIRIARLLVGRGVGPESVVGLHLPRSATLLAAILGVLRSGAAFLPLDVGYPLERLNFMIRDSAADLVLSEGALNLEVEVDVLDVATPAPMAIDAPLPAPQADQLAYVIYTSGSTGQPKGVGVTGGGLAALLTALESSGVARPGPARVGWNASPSFDASVQQWVRVCRGDTVVIISEEVRSQPEALAALAWSEQLTDLDLTPAHAEVVLEALDEAVAGRTGTELRLIIGGEAIPRQQWEKLGRLAEQGRLHAVNVYGVTEATVDTTWAPIEAGVAPHLGDPLAGASVRLLDSWLRPVPRGTTGEMYLAGAGLARGYLGRGGLTASRFVPDPWAGDGSRLYRTGDLARFTNSGRLEYRGRNDLQVKIRGYRLELGEIEAVLAAYAGVQECVVVRRPTPDGGSLAAFLRTAGRIDPQQLRQHVAQHLPEWMQPSTYSFLAKIPRTSTGKADRSMLETQELVPDPSDRSAEKPATEDAPQGAIENMLADIWCDVLGVDQVRASDDFFQRGGHSLLAIRVVARLKRRAQLVIPMTAVFQNPVLRDLAGYVEQHIREQMGLRP